MEYDPEGEAMSANVDYIHDEEEYVKLLLQYHHPMVVTRFLQLRNGAPHIGLMRVKVDGGDTSAIAEIDEDNIHILFIAPTDKMKIESTDGKHSATKSFYDKSGNEVKKH